MPLNLADINTDYTIQKICGNEDDRHHLETLGFIEGATVRIVSILLGSYIVRITGKQNRYQSGFYKNDHRAGLKKPAQFYLSMKQGDLFYP